MSLNAEKNRSKIVVGTRGSALAKTQTGWVVNLLREIVPLPVEITIIQTKGDRITDVPLRSVEGKGFFTKEIEDALYDRRIDVAVHSLKDLPVDPVPGLTIAAIPPREDPGELLLIHPDCIDDGEELGVMKGAIVGTGSLRRKTQVHAIRPDLVFRELRGNVTTRVRKLKEKQYHAILVAAAGYRRLKLKPDGYVIRPLPVDMLLPAPGQGALAVQVRADDKELIGYLKKIHHPLTEHSVYCERELLKLLEGGCHLPLGAYARYADEVFELNAVIGNPQWTQDSLSPLVRITIRASDGFQAARQAFREIQKRLTESSLNYISLSKQQRIILTRSGEGNMGIIEKLSGLPVRCIEYPLLFFQPCADSADQVHRIRDSWTDYGWVLFTSKNAVKFFAGHFPPDEFPAHVLTGCIGPGTDSVARESGFHPAFVSTNNTSRKMLEEFIERYPRVEKKILIPSPRIAQDTLYNGLIERGYDVEKIVLYETATRAREELPDPGIEPGDWLVFMSPSAVTGFIQNQDLDDRNLVFSIGPVTTDAIIKTGFKGKIMEPDSSNLDSLIEKIRSLLNQD